MMLLNFRLARMTVCTALLVCARVSLTAQQKLANTPAVASALSASPLTEDARLQQNVVVHVEGLPIGELLEQLSTKTSVAFSVQRDIADEKVIAFSPARPLRDTLTDLAALFNNQWERMEGDKSKGEAVRYRLIRGPRARELEDDLLNGPRRRMMAQLDAMTDALSETPDQLRQRPETDIVRACLLDPNRRLATQIYSILPLDQRTQLFVRGSSPNVLFSALTPPQQDTLRQWLEGHNAIEQRRDQAENLEQQPYPRRDSGVIPVQDFERNAFRLIILNNANAGEADVRLQINWSIYLPLRHLRDDKTLRLPRHGNPYNGQPVAQSVVLPTQESLKQAGKENLWIDQLRSLAETTHQPVFSDYFRSAVQQNADLSTGVSSTPLPGTSPAMARMDTFSRAMQRVWWVRGDSLLLRTQQWYRQREYETPDKWMREVSQHLAAQNNTPTYADIGRILELTPRQLFGLMNTYNPPVVQAATADRMVDGALEFARLVYELKGVEHSPLTVKESMFGPNTSNASVKSTMKKGGGDKPIALGNLPWTDLPASARSLAMEALSAVFPMNYVETQYIQYVAYCEYPSTLVPLQPDPALDKARENNFRRRNLPNISPDEKQELEEERQADVLKQINYMLHGPRKRDVRYVKIGGMVRLGVPNKEDTSRVSYSLMSGADAILPLKIPDDRRDKTLITLIKE